MRVIWQVFRLFGVEVSFVDDIYDVLCSHGPDIDIEFMVDVLLFIAIEAAYDCSDSDKDADRMVDHFVENAKKLKRVK